MAAHFDIRQMVERSSDEKFEDTTLADVLLALPAVSPTGPWIAGGAVRRTIAGEEPKSDFDYFFSNADQLSLFADKMESAGLTKTKETPHHIQFRGRVGKSDIPKDVQLIRFKYYANAADVVDSFDFTVCQFAFDGERLTTGDMSLWDLGRKRLAVHKITYPVSSMRRALKYARQGFTLCNGCIAQILRETATRPDLMAALDIAYVD